MFGDRAEYFALNPLILKAAIRRLEASCRNDIPTTKGPLSARKRSSRLIRPLIYRGSPLCLGVCGGERLSRGMGSVLLKVTLLRICREVDTGFTRNAQYHSVKTPETGFFQFWRISRPATESIAAFHDDRELFFLSVLGKLSRP